jgi:signal transduction histidine kinase
VAWLNARFLAQRIERLAGASATADQRLTRPLQAQAVAPAAELGGALRGVVSAVAPNRASRLPDEIDAIQLTLDRLSRAVESDRAGGQHLAERVRDHARLLASVADDATKQLDNVRLPLHILLDNRFGELNENQEEMLGAARMAAEAIAADLTSLRQIAELDLGNRPMHLERLRPADLIEGIRPLLAAAAEAREATLATDVAPLLPAIKADRFALQEALTTLLKLPIVDVDAGVQLRLFVLADSTDGAASNRSNRIDIRLQGGKQPQHTIQSALAARIVAAHGGRVEKDGGALRIVLPTEHAELTTKP